MNKTFIIAATIGLIATSGLARANDSEDDRSGSDYGTVVKLDRASGSITLADGSSYTDPVAGELKGIKVGEKVRITYSDSNVVSISR
jgi:hypothetical protein